MYQLNLFDDTKEAVQQATKENSLSQWLEHEKMVVFQKVC